MACSAEASSFSSSAALVGRLTQTKIVKCSKIAIFLYSFVRLADISAAGRHIGGKTDIEEGVQDAPWGQRR